MNKKTKPLMPKTSIKLNVQVVVFKEEEHWVGYCPSLDISSYGDNVEEAKIAVEDALAIFLEETNRKGSLERYLLNMGWQLQRKPKPVYKQPVLSNQLNRSLLKKSHKIFQEKFAIPLA